MTNLEALSASSNYPIDTVKIQKILIDNGLNDSDVYTGPSKAFELSTAALYTLIITSANLSEGDYSVSASEKSSLLKLASGIYDKYGVQNPLGSNTIRNVSNYW